MLIKRTVVILAIFVALGISYAWPHVISRPDLDSWFDGLASGKGLCCSFVDGKTVADPDWDSKDRHYRVKLDGQWIDVPDNALITEPNKFGRTMVWPVRITGTPVEIRCFMPGSMT
jgi:hypothetical protein